MKQLPDTQIRPQVLERHSDHVEILAAEKGPMQSNFGIIFG